MVNYCVLWKLAEGRLRKQSFVKLPSLSQKLSIRNNG